MLPRFILIAAVLFGFPSWLLQAQEKESNAQPPLERIAFGSCAEQNRPLPIWEAIVQAKPDLFLFLGDNIYGDTNDMKVLRQKYQMLANQPGYQKLLKTCPVLATWDDHDFGLNDSGGDYPQRKESQKVFLEFFGVPKSSPRWQREGVYESYMFGPADKRVQIILLDARYFRSPLKKRAKTVPGTGPYVADTSKDAVLLGEQQWAWLEQQLKQPARLRLIGSGIQVVAEDHGWEKWMNMPRERERLFQLIRSTKANGVIFLSGDRHLAELSQMDAGVGYPIYDLTSSGLNQASKKWRSQETNSHRVATMNFGNNFGLVAVDWDRKDPLISLQIRDEAGDIMIQHKIPLSLLQVGTLRLPSSVRAKLSTGEILSAAVIAQHLNKEVKVCLQVQATGQNKQGSLVFLNSSPDFKSKDNLAVVLKAEALQQFQSMNIAEPRRHFQDKMIEVTGTLSAFRGEPQILVTDAKQIRVLEEQ